jgi:hypothetical protein
MSALRVNSGTAWRTAGGLVCANLAACSVVALKRGVIRLHRLIAGGRIGDDGADRHLAGTGHLHLGSADAEDIVGVDKDAPGLQAAIGTLKADAGAVAADIRNGDRNRLAVGVCRAPGALPLCRIDIGKLRAWRDRGLRRGRIGRLENAEDVGRC